MIFGHKPKLPQTNSAARGTNWAGIRGLCSTVTWPFLIISSKRQPLLEPIRQHPRQTANRKLKTPSECRVGLRNCFGVRPRVLDVTPSPCQGDHVALQAGCSLGLLQMKIDLVQIAADPQQELAGSDRSQVIIAQA